MTAPIVKDVTFNASAERVFAALTDPQQLPKFWGEGVRRWELDVRPGGRWASYGSFPDGNEFAVTGIFRHVHPNELVEMTVEHTVRQSKDVAEQTVVCYELTATGGRTHLRVTHSGFVNKRFRDDHSTEWDAILERMSAFVVEGSS